MGTWAMPETQEDRDRELKIEHNIEMLDAHRSICKKFDNIREVILLMQVGDSVLFTDRRETERFRARADSMRKRQEVTGKLSQRKVNAANQPWKEGRDSGPIAWRIWRVE